VSKPAFHLGFGLIVATAVFGGGCSDPEAMLPSAPPGINSQALLREQTKDEEAEALGETAPKAGVAAKPQLADIPLATPTAKGETKKTASGIEYTTIKEGTGAVAKVGLSAKMHYVGTLDDGRKFDSSRDPGKKPFEFLVGAGSVIKGWDEGVPGMHIGEIRKLTIPPAAGYGALGHGSIPPNATLHFEVELMDVK